MSLIHAMRRGRCMGEPIIAVSELKTVRWLRVTSNSDMFCSLSVKSLSYKAYRYYVEDFKCVYGMQTVLAVQATGNTFLTGV